MEGIIIRWHFSINMHLAFGKLFDVFVCSMPMFAITVNRYIIYTMCVIQFNHKFHNLNCSNEIVEWRKWFVSCSLRNSLAIGKIDRNDMHVPWGFVPNSNRLIFNIQIILIIIWHLSSKVILRIIFRWQNNPVNWFQLF